VHQGKELSYTNLLDLDARAAESFSSSPSRPPPSSSIRTPAAWRQARPSYAAYIRARDADAKSAFGGIVGLNQHVDVATARAITSTFIEAVIAPSIEGEALGGARREAEMRVVTADFSKAFEALALARPLRSRARFWAASCCRSQTW